MRISDWSSDVCSSDLNDKSGKADNIAGRFILEWEPTDALNVSLNLNAWRDQNDPQAPQRIAFTPQNDVSGSPVVGPFNPAPGGPVPYPQASYPNAPRTARAADWTPEFAPEQDNRFKQGILRSEEHTSELQSLMRISYAVFCLKKKKQI